MIGKITAIADDIDAGANVVKNVFEWPVIVIEQLKQGEILGSVVGVGLPLAWWGIPDDTTPLLQWVLAYVAIGVSVELYASFAKTPPKK